MKKRVFLVCILFTFFAEIAALVFFALSSSDFSQDAVAVNEVIQSVQRDWEQLDGHAKSGGADYVVVDAGEKVLYRTREALSETINAAVSHRDTILDVEKNGKVVGKVILFNDGEGTFFAKKQTLVLVLSIAVSAQGLLCIGYVLYLRRVVVKPFERLKGFAERIADGNLDIPLEMDRHNLFGAFTESFDIMRSELKRARVAEAEANASKKELVAKLSHDIKTPVASIKAASEVRHALSETERMKENYAQIIQKTDQINTLVTNLFTATLEELRQLSVTPGEMASGEIRTLLENSDYLRRSEIPPVPECLVRADKLRLQQVFDNLYANSYKYADTKIDVFVSKEENRLQVALRDYGGVDAGELPLLKEKFKRGDNAAGVEGAGLGLYISDYFMREMGGELTLENTENGLAVTVGIGLIGKI